MATDEPSDSLPLADVFGAANDLLTAGLMEDWALGGALAAIYYVEPFATYHADIFFIPKHRSLASGIPGICAHLQAHGWEVEREHLLVRGFPVQFIAAGGLTEEAVREAERIDYEGVPPRYSGPNTSWPSRPAWAGPRTGIGIRPSVIINVGLKSPIPVSQ